MSSVGVCKCLFEAGLGRLEKRWARERGFGRDAWAVRDGWAGKAGLGRKGLGRQGWRDWEVAGWRS